MTPVAWWWLGCAEEKPFRPSETDASDSPHTGVVPEGWRIETLGEGGLQSRLSVGPDGTVAAVSFANQPWTDGVCDTVVGTPPRNRQTLFAATRGATGSWSVEVIDEPVVAAGPTGVALAWDPTGAPRVAYTGGEPQDTYCGANDAVLAGGGPSGWTAETASASSGDSATGLPASDAGFVVGLWPSLAFGPDGEPALLHQDTHFGSMQHDDLYRADAEIAERSGGGWVHEAVDAGEGAGGRSALVFDADGRAVAFYAVTVEAVTDSRHGVWAARREGDGSWTRVRLHTGAIDDAITAEVDPGTGDLVVAFYSAADRAARVRRLADSGAFSDPAAWTSELVAEPAYDDGHSVSLALAPDGEPVLAYRRCKLLTSASDGCDPSDEALVFAKRTAGAWTRETVVSAEGGSCGESASVDVGDDGTVWVSYRCTIRVDDTFAFRWQVAGKEAE